MYLKDCVLVTDYSFKPNPTIFQPFFNSKLADPIITPVVNDSIMIYLKFLFRTYYPLYSYV